jgi:hypothetical protein
MCLRLPSSLKPDESTKPVCRKLDIVPNSKYHGGKRQICSDNEAEAEAEADAEADKSGTEEIPVKIKKKRRKILRKRKKVKKCVQGMWHYLSGPVYYICLHNLKNIVNM